MAQLMMADGEMREIGVDIVPVLVTLILLFPVKLVADPHTMAE